MGGGDRTAKGLKLDTLVACADFVKWNWCRVQTSPYIHTDFPDIAGKYVHCPAKVFSIYPTSGHTER